MTKKHTKLQAIYFEILTALYAEATPPVSFQDLMDHAEKNNIRDDDGRLMIPYEDYYLDKDRYDKIVDEIVKKHKLSESDKRVVLFHAYLGCGPTSKEREELS